MRHLSYIFALSLEKLLNNSSENISNQTITIKNSNDDVKAGVRLKLDRLKNSIVKYNHTINCRI